MSRAYCLIILLACVFSGPVLAQVDRVGTDDTFEIATWNIEWFGERNNGPGDEDRQLRNATTVILDSGIDLWALQEIADVSHFEALVATLGPDWDSVLAELSSGQRMAYVFDTDVVALRSSSQILQSFNYEFASRPPLKAEFEITLPDTTFIMTAINVHMKAFSDQQSYDRRVEAASRIKTHIDFTSIRDDPVVFLGDFNDNLEGSIHFGEPSPYEDFINDTDNYYPVTLELEQEGIYSFCNTGSCTIGSSIDHIIVSTEFVPLLAFGLTNRLSSALDIQSFTTTTSDHLPVYAVFRDYIDTSAESAVDVPAGFALSGVYPNPFRSELTATVALHGPADVRVELVDVLGRVVASQAAGILPAGEYNLELRPGNVPAGAYFLRISSPESSSVRPVLKAGRR